MDSSEERHTCYGVCFVFLGDSHDGSKQHGLPCTDQFPSHHCMHKRRSGPNTSTFLNMKETTPKPPALVLEVLIMQSRTNRAKLSHTGMRLSCVLVMPPEARYILVLPEGPTRASLLSPLSTSTTTHHRFFHHLHLHLYHPSIFIRRQAV